MINNYHEGELYFMVSYEDNALLYPEIESLIFVGKNIADDCGEGDCWYFQDASSYSKCGAFPNDEDGDGKIYALPEEGLYRIVEFDGMVNELTECLKRRKSRTI